MARASRFPIGLDRVHGRPVASAGAAGAELLRPQRPLQQAAQDAARLSVPSGLGLASAAVRERMVARLRADGVRCEPVLQALLTVERHRFVDTALATQAYEDTSLPIGHGQTISKPSVVAHMLSLLFGGAYAREHGHLGRTLEIGTGCGYQAALLTLLTCEVVSIERLESLHDKACAQLAGYQESGPHLVHGDGRLGYPPRAPYHSIVAAAGGVDMPAAWLEQLAVGGRLVAPMHDATSGGQVLLVVDRQPDGLVTQRHDAVHFVPLKSGTA